MRAAPLLVTLLALGAASCSDDVGDDQTSDAPEEAPDHTGTTAAPAGEGSEGEGTISVRLEETDAIFFEGFEVGLRFTDATSGDEIERAVWSEEATLPDGAGPEGLYDAVYELTVPAGTVRVGADVNIGIGPGPAPPDLDADPMPCELDVEVPGEETVNVVVTFDDAADDCLQVVEGIFD